MEKRIFILGKLPYAELIQLYKHAVLFIMPNIPVSGDMEGFGLNALEASVNGAVVVASNLEGIKDAIKDGQNGFLVEPLNAKAWQEKIEELLKNKNQLKELASRFQDYSARHCGWDKMVYKYKDLFSRYIQ